MVYGVVVWEKRKSVLPSVSSADLRFATSFLEYDKRGQTNRAQNLDFPVHELIEIAQVAKTELSRREETQLFDRRDRKPKKVRRKKKTRGKRQ